MTIERNVKGLLGTKLGMTQTWDENNRVVPVTVIAAGTNVVTQVRGPEKDGYNAVQIGYGEIEGRKVNKPKAGHFAAAGVTPRRHLVEIRTADAAVVHRRPGAHPRDVRRRRGRRRDRDQQGQGLRRRHEAARLPRCRRLARCAPQPPQAGLHRRLLRPRAGSSRACGWPARWVASRSPPRT